MANILNIWRKSKQKNTKAEAAETFRKKNIIERFGGAIWGAKIFSMFCQAVSFAGAALLLFSVVRSALQMLPAGAALSLAVALGVGGALSLEKIKNGLSRDFFSLSFKKQKFAFFSFVFLLAASALSIFTSAAGAKQAPALWAELHSENIASDSSSAQAFQDFDATSAALALQAKAAQIEEDLAQQKAQKWGGNITSSAQKNIKALQAERAALGQAEAQARADHAQSQAAARAEIAKRQAERAEAINSEGELFFWIALGLEGVFLALQFCIYLYLFAVHTEEPEESEPEESQAAKQSSQKFGGFVGDRGGAGDNSQTAGAPPYAKTKKYNAERDKLPASESEAREAYSGLIYRLKNCKYQSTKEALLSKIEALEALILARGWSLPNLREGKEGKGGANPIGFRNN